MKFWDALMEEDLRAVATILRSRDLPRLAKQVELAGTRLIKAQEMSKMVPAHWLKGSKGKKVGQ